MFFSDIKVLFLNKQKFEKYLQVSKTIGANAELIRSIGHELKASLDNYCKADYVEFETIGSPLTEENQKKELAFCKLVFEQEIDLHNPSPSDIETLLNYYLYFSASEIAPNHWYLEPTFRFSNDLYSSLSNFSPQIMDLLLFPGNYDKFEDIYMDEYYYDYVLFPVKYAKLILEEFEMDLSNSSPIISNNWNYFRRELIRLVDGNTLILLKYI